MPNINEATRQYIRTHENEDVRKLALHRSNDPQVDMSTALQQIEGRQKAKEKLPDLYVNEDILYPSTLSLEQCSSSITAQYKASILGDGADDIADLSGGFGVDTFAFARKFKHCFYVEPQASLCELARHNASALGFHNIDFLQGTMEEQLPLLPTTDHIFLDPSRRDVHGDRVVSIEDCSPNILQWKGELLRKVRKSVLVKLSPMIDLKRTMQQLSEVASIHIVAVHGECKEVLFLLTPNGSSIDDIPITAVNLHNEESVSFQFSTQEENNANPTLAHQVGQYLYEPNAAILKAGAFKSIAVLFGLNKLHPHSHLYTSDNLVAKFPGRIFQVQEVLPFNKKSIKSLSEIRQANISTRNFPLTPEALKKALKIKDGGDLYLFGTTLTGGNLVIIVGRKIVASVL